MDLLKKTLKILLSLMYIVGLTFEINLLCKEFSGDAILLIVLSISVFLFHLFAWWRPKELFDFCWKFSKYSPDNWDYDTSYSNIGNVGLGMLVAAIIFWGISFLLTI